MTVALLRRSWAGATVRHLARAMRPATAVMAIPSRFPVASAKPLSSTPEVKEIAGVQFQIDSLPAPGSPFHLAFPVHDLQQARHFWGTVMGCTEGRCLPDKWIDFCLYGHQIVCHWVGHNYKAAEHFNPVGGDEVPVPHFGIVLKKDEFDALAQRLTDHGVAFVIPPQKRFEVNRDRRADYAMSLARPNTQGKPGEQWTMFLKDPSNNALEFKSMANPDFLFARYHV